MTAAFTGHPIATFLLAITLVLWFLIEAAQALRRREDATPADRGSLMVLRLAAAVGILLAALGLRIHAAAYPYSPVLMTISLVCVWVGVALRVWSFRTLGRYFTFQVMTSADQPVITTGPYRVLRHPSYTGLLLVLLGIGISFGNWISLVAFTVLPLIGVVRRIRVEEAALASALGASYTTFASGRKRLVPFVW